MSKVAKGKGKTHGKMEKTRKCAEEQDNESTDSLQSYDSKGCLLAVNKRNLVRDFLRQRGAPPAPVAFPKDYLDRMVLFLSSFGPAFGTFIPLLIFP